MHADRIRRGGLGRRRRARVDAPPTVILSISTQGQAIVEGVAVDADGQPCPTYTDLLVNPPDTTAVVTVPATIEACELQVHPITAV